MSDPEAAAIRAYTSGDYEQPNSALRHPDKDPALAEKMKPYTKVIESGLDKLPAYESETYRGTTLSPEASPSTKRPSRRAAPSATPGS